MVEKSAGSIVNLSSIAARRTHPKLLIYSVSAAALDQMTRSLAVSLAPHRIRVNAVAVGSVMSASLQGFLKENSEYRAEIEDQVQQFLKKGGNIDVVKQGGADQQRQLGSIWQNLDDEIGLS